MKNDNKIAKAGNSGPKVRSDCQVTIELKSSGGLKIDLNSKVKAIYEKSIINLIKNVFNSFGLKNAVINMNDSGALDFVLSARLEAAIKQLINTDEEFLPEMISENYSSSNKNVYV